MTVSGMKVGTVSNVSLRNGDALVTFAIKGNVLLGSETTAHIRTDTLLGERVLALESAGNSTMDPMARHPGLAHVLALLADGSGQRLHIEHRRDQHQRPQPVVGHAVGDARPDRTPIGADLRRPHPVIPHPQQPQQDPGRAIQECRRRHRDPVRTQPAGQRADPQRQRSDPSASDRRQEIVDLLANTSAVSKQLTGSGARQREATGADAGKAESVNEMLEKNSDNISKAMPGLAKYEITHGELSPACTPTQRVGPEHFTGAILPTVPRLRLGVPQTSTRPAVPAYNAGASGGDSFPVQRHSGVPGSTLPHREEQMIPLNSSPSRPSSWSRSRCRRGVPRPPYVLRPNHDYGLFPTATAIYPGDEVRVSGVKVGKIESISRRAPRRK